MAKARRVKKEREATGWSLLPFKAPALPCVVTLTRVAPRRMDGDNLQGACKAVRDAVADWLRVDDGSPLITWRYAQRQGRPKEYAVEILLQGMS